MKIRDRFGGTRRVFSFEVFPPRRDDKLAGLWATMNELRALEPDFVSVTYGAGGSTREATTEVALRLMELGLVPLVHVTCVGRTRRDLAAMLDSLYSSGVRNVLALRGDPPKGESSFRVTGDGFRYASELVRFIRAQWDLCVGVAGYPETHPEAKSPQADLQALKEKVAAGADFIITQLFFDNRLYFDYVARLRAAGVIVPVLPGIMPVLDARSLSRFSAFGARVPEVLARGLDSADKENRGEGERQFGLSYAVAQCRELLNQGAPGVHVYTMNQAWAAVRIHHELGSSGVGRASAAATERLSEGA